MLDPMPEPPADDLNRRVMAVRVSRELFAGMFKTTRPDTYIRCVKGLPDDAELIGITDQVHFMTDEITLKFRSKEFPAVQPGNCLTTTHPLYSAVTVTADELKMLDEFKRAGVTGLRTNGSVDVTAGAFRGVSIPPIDFSPDPTPTVVVGGR